jgi:hypothetical protein
MSAAKPPDVFVMAYRFQKSLMKNADQNQGTGLDILTRIVKWVTLL